jgi:hypothetical protein
MTSGDVTVTASSVVVAATSGGVVVVIIVAVAAVTGGAVVATTNGDVVAIPGGTEETVEKVLELVEVVEEMLGSEGFKFCGECAMDVVCENTFSMFDEMQKLAKDAEELILVA